MDQGTIVEPDDRRTWTPLRMLFMALGAIAGGILLSITLGGPARADSPHTPPEPAASRADTSLVGQVTGALTDITRTALAPVDDLVATVMPGTAAAAVPPRPAPTASTAASGAIPAALDDVLATAPFSSAPLWQGIVGQRPVQELVTPLAVVLRPLAPGVADLLSPAPWTSSGLAADAIMTSPDSPVAAAPPPALVRGTGASPAAGAAASPMRQVEEPAPAPRTPLGASDDALMSVASGGTVVPAVLVAFVAALLLIALTARRRGWTLPSAPAFGADVSPD